MDLAQRSMSSSPLTIAAEHTRESHGQPFIRLHLSISKSPRRAAAAHTLPSHGQPLALHHCSACSGVSTAARNKQPGGGAGFRLADRDGTRVLTTHALESDAHRRGRKKRRVRAKGACSLA